MFLFFQIPALTRTVLISLIAFLTLLGIMIRPYKRSEAIIALAGAGMLLDLGLLSPGVGLNLLHALWSANFLLGCNPALQRLLLPNQRGTLLLYRR